MEFVVGSDALTRGTLNSCVVPFRDLYHRPEAQAVWQDPSPSGGGYGTIEPPGMSTGKMFFRGWTLITGIEIVLLGVTASMPKEWTGWSSTFVQDGLDHLGEAYSGPPVWDDDHWFHNYIGHPYGGSVYYNTVRSQGASPVASFFFAGLLSMQWEYLFEAVAERPSTQDLIITPFAGALMGEMVHQLTQMFRQNGTNVFEKTFILLFNPTSIVFTGWN